MGWARKDLKLPGPIGGDPHTEDTGLPESKTKCNNKIVTKWKHSRLGNVVDRRTTIPEQRLMLTAKPTVAVEDQAQRGGAGEQGNCIWFRDGDRDGGDIHAGGGGCTEGSAPANRE